MAMFHGSKQGVLYDMVRIGSEVTDTLVPISCVEQRVLADYQVSLFQHTKDGISQRSGSSFLNPLPDKAHAHVHDSLGNARGRHRGTI